MAIAATPVNYPRGEPPSRCAECGNVLVDALVLSCGHDLCLACAASALRQTRSLSGRTVRCLLCPSITELCEEAAATLTAEQKLEQGGFQPQLLPQPQACSAWIPPPGARTGTALYPPRIPNERAVRGLREAESPHSQDGSVPRAALATPLTAVNALRPQASTSSVSPVQWQRTPEPVVVEEPSRPSGRTVHIYRCPEHPEEPATYFCATCECPCICAECVIQKNGRHRDHEVLRVGRAHEVLKSRAGALLDEAIALEDDFSMVGDRLAWRRKDIERAAARGRASVRSAFARVRAQLNEREAELLEPPARSLDAYESGSLSSLDTGHAEYGSRLSELRKLQENLRSRCRNDGDAVEALNTFSAAKAAITSLREAFRQEEYNAASPPDEFVGLAGSARAELDLHAEGLASLEEGSCLSWAFQAVASLCERGVDLPNKASATAPAVRPLPGTVQPQFSLQPRSGSVGYPSTVRQG
ncbi:ribBA [Symbiodinium natans]|uniref:RibBA protein n=1 Tax=Symbiodinium natans TaxID=878477 RepID=A0A812RYK7_9DINO|nr:ribBA [Symbiodinium natans]